MNPLMKDHCGTLIVVAVCKQTYRKDIVHTSSFDILLFQAAMHGGIRF